MNNKKKNLTATVIFIIILVVSNVFSYTTGYNNAVYEIFDEYFGVSKETIQNAQEKNKETESPAQENEVVIPTENPNAINETVPITTTTEALAPIQETPKVNAPAQSTSPSKPKHNETDETDEIMKEPSSIPEIKPTENKKEEITMSNYKKIKLNTLKTRLGNLGDVQDTTIPVDLSSVPSVTNVHAYTVNGYMVGACDVSNRLANTLVCGTIEAELNKNSTSSSTFTRRGVTFTRYDVSIQGQTYDLVYGRIDLQHYFVLSQDSTKMDSVSTVLDAMLGD